MKYLSVCSGIEAATVAWHSLGWTPLAFSEIEAFPRAVLQYHYPNVPLYGDFTKLRDEPIIEDADILVGGTPCQAFSVAGLRKSLGDDRGNLTLEFVRLADAIDNARLDRGKSASIIVWENVPGVLSVKDNAFGCFLSGLAGDDTPYVPPRGKWTNAGVVAGPKRTVAWRVLDAQYFGLAQRRRRVFVVASAGDGFDPAAVLFECEGVRRDTPPRREAGEAASNGATNCAGERNDKDEINRLLLWRASDQANAETLEDMAGTLNCNVGQRGGLLCSVNAADEIAETLIATDHKGPSHNRDHNFIVTSSVVGAISCNIGPNGHDAGNFACNQAVDAGHVLPVVANTLKANNGGGGFGSDPSETFLPVTYPINTQIALRHQALGERTGLGIGAEDDPAFTLQAGHSHAVAFGGDVARTLSARHDSSPCVDRGMDVVATNMAVRRLTPVECERLQGFPDGYTNIPWRKKSEAPDGPRYRALGNSMAVPVMRWIGQRIARA